MPNTEMLNRNTWGEWVRENRPKVASTSPSLRKMMTTEVVKGSVNPATGMEQFTFVASTETVDREGDIIMSDGWDLEAYSRNPVVLFGHDYRSLPVGRAVAVKIEQSQLHVSVDFTPDDVNPDGYRIYKLVQAGFLNAVSVGFRPIKYIWNDEHNGYDFQGQELLELSIVPVPANQEALLAAALGDPLQRGLADMDSDIAKNFSAALAEIMEQALPDDDESDHDGGTTPSETAPLSITCSAADPTDTSGLLVLTSTSSTGDIFPITLNYEVTTGSSPWDVLPPIALTFTEPFELIYQEPKPEEDDMDNETAKALVEAVEALGATVKELTEKVDAFEESLKATEDGDELTQDQITDLVRETVDSVRTATTGQLPD